MFTNINLNKRKVSYSIFFVFSLIGLITFFSFFVSSASASLVSEPIIFSGSTPTSVDNSIINVSELGDIIICQYSTSPTSLYWFKNGETTWNSTSTGGYTNNCDISNDADFISWRNGFRIFRRTNDGGLTWTDADVYDAGNIDIDSLSVSNNGQNFLTTKVRYLMASMDNGNSFFYRWNTWYTYNIRYPVNYATDNGFYISGSSEWYTGQSGLGSLQYTTDFNSYIPIKTNVDIYQMDISDNEKYGCAIDGFSGNIYFTNNYTSWDSGYITNTNGYSRCKVDNIGNMFLYADTNSNYNVVKMDLENIETTPVAIITSENNKVIESFDIVDVNYSYIYCEDAGLCYYADEVADVSVIPPDTVFPVSWSVQVDNQPIISNYTGDIFLPNIATSTSDIDITFNLPENWISDLSGGVFNLTLTDSNFSFLEVFQPPTAVISPENFTSDTIQF
ncbi:MAG: hypothetical protein PHS54_06255, partial [Clostridia bacterium]|nr:hypothetical protein [Clostridia bacterium]